MEILPFWQLPTANPAFSNRSSGYLLACTDIKSRAAFRFASRSSPFSCVKSACVFARLEFFRVSFAEISYFRFQILCNHNTMADQEEPTTSFRRIKKRPKTLRQQENEVKPESPDQTNEDVEGGEQEVR
jgi:hypothetical protein